MRKIYLLASLFLIGASAIAQMTPVQHKLKSAASNKHPMASPMHNRNNQPANHSQAVIWSSDFSNPGDWDMTAETGSDLWIIDATGPIGAYSIGPINSTSAANGWATFDSDNYCSGDQIADMTNTTAINCTGHPAVNLKYQEYYRRYIDSTFVLVSNDNVNWTTFSVHSAFANNTATANPANVTINISSVAANQATVWVRFQFYSPSSLGTGSGCGYAWEIDDVSVEDIPDHDIALVPKFPSPYTEIPKSQAVLQPIALSARINNLGGNTETNVGFTAYVFEIHGGTPTLVFGPTPTNTQASLLPNDTTTTTLTAGNFNLTDTGVYAFLYIASMTNTDENGLNDTLLNFIIVTDSMYAKDYADIDGMLSGAIGANTNTIDLAQDFQIFSATQVRSATFYLGFATPGDQLKVSIYNCNASGVPTTVAGTTPNYTITTADTNNWVTVNFTAPIAVGVGKFAIALTQLSTVDNIALAYTDNVYTPATGFYRTPAGSGAWTSLDGSTFHIAYILRPNIAIPVGIDENSFSSNIYLYPNPANGKVYIHNGNQAHSDYTLSVFNNLGALVYSKSYDNFVNEVIDFSDMSNGVYTFQLKSVDNIVTKSLVISNN
jgi:hypothetical protein